MSNIFIEPEGATPLTAEEKLGLIPSHISTREDLNAAEQQNIIKGEIWAFSRKRNILDVSTIRELHRKMFSDVWRWAGAYSREVNRRIGSDSHRIETDLHQLVSDIQYWVTHDTYSPDEIAIRFHHGLTKTHPFPGGNGRLSRLCADILIKQLNRERFTWGRGNLMSAGETRTNYINALRAADNHNFTPLLDFARSGSIT